LAVFFNCDISIFCLFSNIELKIGSKRNAGNIKSAINQKRIFQKIFQLVLLESFFIYSFQKYLVT
jgi:hypothetical protein